MKLTCITKPTAKPVTRDEIKNFCRVLHDDDDDLFDLLIDAVTDFAQNVTGRQLCTATYEVVASPKESPLRLPNAPLRSITSVTCNGVTLDYSSYYDFDVGFVEYTATDDVTIRYESGYDKVPKSLQAWCLNKISTLYEHRENIVVGISVAEIPSSMIDCILDHYKVRYL
ncbi:head-tail connector protein [Sulfurospirillum cavolei]|uniref:head-tail connector protein n=1 Tax=Sulfurospirillum cavolei TaxID=366522 RepID=UPI003FA1F42B